MGVLCIVWLYQEDDRYDGQMSDVYSAIQIVKDYGLGHQFTSSSSFIERNCDEKEALEIKDEILKLPY